MSLHSNRGQFPTMIHYKKPRVVRFLSHVSIVWLLISASMSVSQTINKGIDNENAAKPKSHDEGKSKPPSSERKSRAKGIIDRLDQPNKSIDLSDLVVDESDFSFPEKKGKIVVIYFWSSADKLSLDGLPEIRAAATAHKAAVFYGVNVARGASETRAAPDGIELPGIQRRDPVGLAGGVARHFRVTQVPIIYVFDQRASLSAVCLPREIDDVLISLMANTP